MKNIHLEETLTVAFQRSSSSHLFLSKKKNLFPASLHLVQKLQALEKWRRLSPFSQMKVE